MTVQEQHYLTAGDVTRLLRIDKSTVYRMAEDGRLPGFKIGRQWRFRSEDVESALGIAVPKISGAPIDLGHAQRLAGLFSELFDVMVVVTDMNGHPLTDVINKSDYFTVLDADPAVVDACAAEWGQYAHDYEFEPVLQESHLGFMCARAFIRDGFELVAMVIVGGIAPNDWPNPQLIATVAEEHGIDRDRLVEVAPTLPILDSHRRDDLLTALSVLARHLSPPSKARSTS